jgi:hypothetical protein
MSLPNPNLEAIEAYTHSASVLESIGDKYAAGSVERELLKKAAFALYFSTTYFNDQFEAFLSTFEVNGLSPEQKAHLQSMGIDPEAPLGE